MNFVKFFFVSGESYFYGAFLIVIAAVVSSLSTRRRYRDITLFIAAFGFLLVILSTTPASLWLYLTWLLLILFWSFFLYRQGRKRPGMHLISCALVVLISIMSMVMEWAYWRSPDIQGECKTVYVIGDSISGGIGREKLTWPQIMQRDHSVKVINLAVGGSTVSSAMKQVQAIRSSNVLVILEIGGNDLLQYSQPMDFENGLRALLKAVQAPGRILVMFELPLFPTRKPFGQIQRRLAAEFKVHLIPKRYFAGVLLCEDGTIDGIHLSDIGHQKMANLVWNMVCSRLNCPITAGKP